ncbi:MAG: arginase family protein [Caldisphaeraceae archaeon]|nr:arginase family protein [Caldisphaeraceae archaeon]
MEENKGSWESYVMKDKKSLLRDAGDLRIRDLKKVVPLIGIPWDWNTSGRPGARFAPDTIRKELFSLTPLSHDLGSIDIGFEDLGDVAVVPGDIAETRKRVEKVSKAAIGVALSRNVPVAFLGGDHAITGWTFDATASLLPETSILVLDAHYDIRKTFEGLTSGSWLYDVCSKRKVNVMVVGVSDYSNPVYAAERAKELGITVLTRSRLLTNFEESLKEIESFSKGKKIYLSIDMDHLDQSFSPGVNSPTPLGLTPYESIRIIDKVIGSSSRLIGVDVTEVAPPYDIGSMTSKLSAKLLLRSIHLAVSKK